MIRPQIDEAKRYFKDFTVIPVSTEMFADVTTSVEVLKTFMKENKKCYLLESVDGGESWGRYSFLGYDPKLTVKCSDNKAYINNGKSEEIITGNPADVLRKILSKYKSPKIEYMPPFTGGLAGYFSYDYIKYVEKSLRLKASNDRNFDDFNLMLFDKVIAFDHLKQKIFIIVNVPVENFESKYPQAVKELQNIEKLILGGSNAGDLKSGLKSDFKMLHGKEKFMEMVEKTKEHIREGDIFQAVISNRAEADFEGSLLQTYRVLRTTNPSPYMFYFNFGDSEIAGASPETLVTLKDGELTNYALAGTCRRGNNMEEDDLLIADLLKDQKELSEHNMLVDLSRNDLGKVSEFGSVRVTEYMKVLKFSHVCHIASIITGKLKAGCDQLDALGAILPAGTLSGAPKKRACEIIDELEGHKRGTYGGAIGYIDFTGNMDMCIAIRMVTLKDGKVYVQAGAGVVADSNPEKEFNECRQKAEAVMSALKEAGK